MHHLEESRLYCEKDLGTARHLLARMREILDKGKESYSQVLIILLDSRLSVCEQGLKRLYDHLSILDPRLYPVHEKMISLGRAMSAAATRQHVSITSVWQCSYWYHY